MLTLAGIAGVDPTKVLSDGFALDRFLKMIAAQGGDPDGAAPRRQAGEECGGRSNRLPRPPRCTQCRRRVVAARRGSPAQGGPGLGDGGRALSGKARRRGHRRGHDPRAARRRRGSLRPRPRRVVGRDRDRRRAPGHRAARARSYRLRGLRPLPRRRYGCDMSPRNPAYSEIVAAPKVLLHDHLDGGLRPRPSSSSPRSSATAAFRRLIQRSSTGTSSQRFRAGISSDISRASPTQSE